MARAVSSTVHLSCSLFTVASVRTRKKKCAATIALICLMIVMFAISIAHYVVIINYTFINILDRDAAGISLINTASFFRSSRVWLPVALEVINVSLASYRIIRLRTDNP